MHLLLLLDHGCASFLEDFISRKPYSTNIPELDDLLKEGKQRMLYQELIMKYLIWLGIPETGSYDIIKKIAKKKFKEEELKELKANLLQGWKDKLNTEEGFEENWQVVEDAAHYSFNASHSLSYAYDSLYGAYLKSHYPLEYYAVALNMYSDDLDRTTRLIDEMKNWNISLYPPRFRHSQSNYMGDKENNAIYKGISSIKFLNENCAKELYNRKDKVYNNFIELLVDLEENSTINSKQLKILIQLDFFEEFGKAGKLMNIYKEFAEGQFKYQKTYCEKTKIKRLEALNDMEFEDVDLPIKDKINAQIEYFGSPTSIKPELKGYAYIMDVNPKGSPKITTYGLGTGKIVALKTYAKTFNKKKLEVGDIISGCNLIQKNKMKKEGEEWVETEELEWWLQDYEIENIGF